MSHQDIQDPVAIQAVHTFAKTSRCHPSSQSQHQHLPRSSVPVADLKRMETMVQLFYKIIIRSGERSFKEETENRQTDGRRLDGRNLDGRHYEKMVRVRTYGYILKTLF